jgi:hypothetical protein
MLLAFNFLVIENDEGEVRSQREKKGEKVIKKVLLYPRIGWGSL